VVSAQLGGAVEHATLCWVSAGRSGRSLYRSGPLPAREIIFHQAEGQKTCRSWALLENPQPIYVFGSMIILGLILVLQKPVLWVGLAAVVAIQTIRARREARVLEEAFGDSYREYRRKTWF
jgi:protein-S-isoprenylcysteine O-methyltransferase Ste14